MKIVSVTVARNESDVIELFVRHHSHIVDEMVIVDHQSSDSTLAILQSLRTEGAPLEIGQELRPELDQARLMTELMHRAARELEADWVIPLDADEFLTTDGSRSARACFEPLDSDLLYRVPWVTYVPRPEDLEGSDPLFDRIRHRRRFEPVPYYKVIAPRSIAGREHVSLKTGNHQMLDGSGRKMKKFPRHDVPSLRLAHFPVRSAAQLAMKVLVGWPARLASAEQNGRQNWHLRSLFHEIRAGRRLEPGDVADFAAAYSVPEEYEGELPDLVRDPVRYAGDSLKLHHAATLDPLSAVAHLAEALATELGQLRRRPPGLGARLRRNIRKP